MFALLIPTGSDHERQRLPLATLSLIAINLAIDLITNLGNYRAIAAQFGFVAAQLVRVPAWLSKVGQRA